MNIRLAKNPRGFAVLRIQGFNNNIPLQIEIQNTNPGQKLPNDEILAATEVFVASLPIQEGVPLALLLPKPAKNEAKATANASQPSSSQPMPEQTVKVLISLVTRPFDPNTARCAALAMSQGGFSRSLAELERLGLVTTVPWGRYRFLVLTDEGRDHLEQKRGIQVPPLPGKGSVQHRLAAQLVRIVFEARGFQVGVEVPIGPDRKLVDLHAQKQGQRIGIEIAMGSSDEESNCIKDLAAGVLDSLMFVFPDSTMLKHWQERFKARPEIRQNLHKVEFALLTNLLKELPL